MFAIQEMTISFREGIVAALIANKPLFGSLPKVNGEVRIISALSLDIYPWHEYCALSMRDSTSSSDVAYSPADWKYFEFVKSGQSNVPALDAAAKVMTDFYNRGKENGMKLNEAAHLLFECGAEALLDPAIAQLLKPHGIRADRIEFIVLDSDGTFRFNYCERLLANRLSEKLRTR